MDTVTTPEAGASDKGYRVEFDAELNGLRAVVVKMDRIWKQHRCGYVAVPAEHALHGKDYSDESGVSKSECVVNESDPVGGFIEALSEKETVSLSYAAGVHGGITYSSGGDGYPVEGEGLWWFGFDCAHFMDNEEGGRSLEFCIAECRKLAAFLSRAGAA